MTGKKEHYERQAEEQMARHGAPSTPPAEDWGRPYEPSKREEEMLAATNRVREISSRFSAYENPLDDFPWVEFGDALDSLLATWLEGEVPRIFRPAWRIVRGGGRQPGLLQHAQRFAKEGGRGAPGDAGSREIHPAADDLLHKLSTFYAAVDHGLQNPPKPPDVRGVKQLHELGCQAGQIAKIWFGDDSEKNLKKVYEELDEPGKHTKDIVPATVKSWEQEMAAQAEAHQNDQEYTSIWAKDPEPEPEPQAEPDPRPWSVLFGIGCESWRDAKDHCPISDEQLARMKQVPLEEVRLKRKELERRQAEARLAALDD